MSDARTSDEQFNYEAIKRCVSDDGWRNARIGPSDLEVFEGIDYFAAHRLAARLVSDRVLIADGLHRWRRVT